jgi:hypothetical protein
MHHIAEIDHQKCVDSLQGTDTKCFSLWKGNPMKPTLLFLFAIAGLLGCN